MRNFLTAVAFSATFMFAGVLNAQVNVWWDWSDYGYRPVPGHEIIDNFGLAGGQGTAENVLSSQQVSNQQINNFYFPGNGATVTASGTNVGTLWLTGDAIDKVGDLRGTANAANVKMYVGGSQSNSITDNYLGTYDGTGVGKFGVNTAANLTLANDSINGVKVPWTNANTKYSVDVAADGTLTGTTTMSGGTLTNGGKIDNLTYRGGDYAGTTGTVDNLIVGINVADYNANYWGTVGKIGFEDGGKVASTGTFADGKLTGSLNFNAESIDLANGNVTLNMDSAMTFDDFLVWAYGQQTFNVADLLGLSIDGYGEGESIFGAGDFAFSWTNEGAEDTLFTLADFENDSDERWPGDWLYSVANGAMSYTKAPGEGVVPEPATLAVLGLGLAGLGLVSRRRKK